MQSFSPPTLRKPAAEDDADDAYRAIAPVNKGRTRIPNAYSDNCRINNVIVANELTIERNTPVCVR